MPDEGPLERLAAQKPGFSEKLGFSSGNPFPAAAKPQPDLAADSACVTIADRSGSRLSARAVERSHGGFP